MNGNANGTPINDSKVNLGFVGGETGTEGNNNELTDDETHDVRIMSIFFWGDALYGIEKSSHDEKVLTQQ